MTARVCTCGHPEGVHQSPGPTTALRDVHFGVCLIPDCPCTEFREEAGNAH